MLFRLFLGVAMATSLHAEAIIEASGELSATTRDRQGDTVGGIGSGIVYDQKNDTYLCVSDRGPGDGTLPYRPRYVVLKIAEQSDRLEPRVVESVIFRDEKGTAMTGLIPDDPASLIPRMKDGRTCIDPEAIALAPDDTLYITDEYGPYLYQFRRDGTMLRRIELPKRFTPLTAKGHPDFTDKAKLTSGRNINQGPEGMCLLPDGKTAALIFQSGLMQEGGRAAPSTPIILIDLETGAPVAEYLYEFATEIPGTGKPLKAGTLSVNDISPLSDKRFLVLERDSTGRNGDPKAKPATYKSVWLIELGSPVKKKFLFNLAGLAQNPATLNAKWEGIAILPGGDNKEVTIMMTADNDFLAPVIHEDGKEHPFPRAQDSVPSQFFKIRVTLPGKP